MNDTVETPEVDLEALQASVTDAEGAVAEAQTAMDAAKENAKTLTASLREAKGNAKQANAYMKSLGDRTDENAADFDAGKESADGWNAEVARLEGELEAAKAAKATDGELNTALKAAKATLKEAKAAMRQAGKPAKERKPKVERESQNGILRPLEGSKSGIAWGLIEAAKEANGGETPTNAQVKEQVDAHNANLGEGEEPLKASRVQSAFRKWRKFNGIAVGAPAPAPTPAPAPEPAE